MATTPVGAIRIHQVMMWLLENPQETAKSCAAHFGVSTPWLRHLMRNDAFRSKLAELQGDLEILCVQTTKSRLEVTAEMAVEKLQEMIANSQSPEFVLEAADRTLHRLGYAPNKAAGPAVQVNTSFVVSREALAAARLQIVDASMAAPDPSDRGETLCLEAGDAVAAHRIEDQSGDEVACTRTIPDDEVAKEVAAPQEVLLQYATAAR